MAKKKEIKQEMYRFEIKAETEEKANYIAKHQPDFNVVDIVTTKAIPGLWEVVVIVQSKSK